MMTEARRDRVLLVLSFLAIHIVWGSTYLAIRYSVETIPPLLTAGLRHVFGGGALFAWCWYRGYRPTAAQWRASLILSVMFFLFGHGSLHWAELIVPSGVAALLIAPEPVWVAVLMALAGYRSRLSASTIFGFILGIAAVAMLVDRPSTIGRPLFIGSIVVVFSAIAWSLGVVYSRSAALHPVPIMSASMTLLCGGGLLVAASAITGSLANFSIANVALRSSLALGYLIVFGSLTFAGYTWLLTRVSPVLVVTHTYTNPIIAVLLGALAGGEKVTSRIILAAVLVVLAILLVHRDTQEERAIETPATTANHESIQSV